MTAAAHCPICLDHFRIDADKPEFVVFPCGHGFCESCTEQLFPTLGNTARCPNCRKFFHQRDGHPLYLELVDSKLAVATELTKSFGQMNVGTPLSSLKEASVKLEQVSKETQHRVVTPLQSAIKDFNERIIPHFTTLENQKQEIESLRKELHRSHQERDLMQTNVDRIGILQEENNRKLHKHLAAMRKELAEAEKAATSDVLIHEHVPEFFGHEVSSSIIPSPPSGEPSPGFPVPPVFIFRGSSSLRGSTRSGASPPSRGLVRSRASQPSRGSARSLVSPPSLGPPPSRGQTSLPSRGQASLPARGRASLPSRGRVSLPSRGRGSLPSRASPFRGSSSFRGRTSPQFRATSPAQAGWLSRTSSPSLSFSPTSPVFSDTIGWD